MKYLWGIIYFSVLIWSGINPKDYFTWILEVFPAITGFVFIVITYRKFTSLVYVLILVHCIILLVGGHYTYAEVPLFKWISHIFHQTRNNYDKLGHFAQGFIPAIIAREILIRNSVINSKSWMNFFIICFCLAISSVYELFEWMTAILSGESAEAFLGTQGDAWDTQTDMLFALIGAVLALISLSGLHDKLLKRKNSE
jgi:putative membrane protein